MEAIKILFAGDFCIRGLGCNMLYDEKIKEITDVISKKTSEYDYSIVNVETVFTDVLSPTKKSGPNLSSPLKTLDLLKGMKFTIGALANNHTCDQGDETGLISKKSVEDLGMLTMGYGKNLAEAQKAIRVEKNGVKISFLNFAENEFVAATNTTPGFAPIDYFENSKLVNDEKKTSDYVFVMLHAGNEHCPFPRKGVIKLSHTLIEAGADGVIIAHPHCPQGLEYYKGKPIAYSMSNFFMSRDAKDFSRWNTGYMADLSINPDKSITITPIPYEFDSHCDRFSFMEGERKDIFLKYLDELSSIITDTDEDEYQKLLYAWSIMYMREYTAFIEEHSKDTSFDGEYMLYIKNAFSCESHNEVMTNYFKVHTTGKLNDFDKYIEKIENWQKLPF